MTRANECVVCGLIATDEGYDVWQTKHQVCERLHILCSPSCLVEWAWKQKAQQQKLSKSKETNV